MNMQIRGLSNPKNPTTSVLQFVRQRSRDLDSNVGKNVREPASKHQGIVERPGTVIVPVNTPGTFPSRAERRTF